MAGGSDGKVYTEASSRETEDLHKVPTARHLSYHLPPTQPVTLPSIDIVPPAKIWTGKPSATLAPNLGEPPSVIRTPPDMQERIRVHIPARLLAMVSHIPPLSPVSNQTGSDFMKGDLRLPIDSHKQQGWSTRAVSGSAKAVSPQHRRTSTQNHADECLHSDSRQLRQFGRGEPTTTNWPSCSSIATTRFGTT
jgi:hypothetical protein